MRSVLRPVALALLFGALVGAVERESWEVYRERRTRLAGQHSDGVILLFGYNEQEAFRTRSAFRQENNFYYLTGWNEPGASVVLLPGKGKPKPYGEILFLPERKPSQERWNGPQVGPGNSNPARKTGFSEVRARSSLETTVRKALKEYGRLYILPPKTPSYGQRPEPDRSELLKRVAPDAERGSVRATLTRMRMVKSEGELRLIQKAVDASIAAHRAAWRKIRPGIFEYQALAPMMRAMIEHGCLRPAYPPIVGAGFNSTVLHYSELSSLMKDGDVVLIDVGGEHAHYAADITRTAPVSGRFSERQRAVYNAVLQAQKAAIQAVKPGMALSGHGAQSLAAIARAVLDSEGRKRAGQPLGAFMVHGLGHHVGLEVHDPGSPHQRLEEGMVITIEPGVYLPDENLGVRIEDMVLVTADGARVLSADLASEPEEVEQTMR